MKHSGLNGSWKKLWLEGVLKDSVVPPFNFEISRPLNVGHRFNGEDFDVITEDDISEKIYEAENFNEGELILLAPGSQTTSNIAHENEDIDPEEDIYKPIPDFTLKRDGFSLAED